jgi:hypothetical protein
LPEAIEPAREILAAGWDGKAPPEAVPVGPIDNSRPEAILVIARFGGVEHIPDLERLLTDETEVNNRRSRREIPVRTRVQDLALIALLHLTGQEPADYSFAPPQDSAQYVYASQSVGFTTSEARAEALSKWRSWRASHLPLLLFGPLDAIEGLTL